MPRKGKSNPMFKAGKRYLVTVWFHEDEYREISKIAVDNSVPRSTVLRWLVKDGLAVFRKGGVEGGSRLSR